jgi:hypothetical protein
MDAGKKTAKMNVLNSVIQPMKRTSSEEILCSSKSWLSICSDSVVRRLKLELIQWMETFARF